MNKDAQTTISSIVALIGMILSFLHVNIAAVNVGGQEITLSNALVVVGIFVWGLLTNKKDTEKPQ